MRNTIFIVLFSVILVSGSVVPATFADHVSAGSGIGAGLGGVESFWILVSGRKSQSWRLLQVQSMSCRIQGLYRFLVFNVDRKRSN